MERFQLQVVRSMELMDLWYWGQPRVMGKLLTGQLFSTKSLFPVSIC